MLTQNFNRIKWYDFPVMAAIIALCIIVRLPSLDLSSHEYVNVSNYEYENGDRYLFEVDSYYYARLMKQYVEDPSLPIIIPAGGDYYDNYRSYTQGFLPAFAAFIWRILSLFGEISLYKIVLWLAPVMAACTSIPAYIFLRRRTHMAGACFGAILAGINAAFLYKTSFGVFDNDMILSLFPMLFICMFIESLQTTVLWKQMAWAVASALSFTAIVTAWSSYSVFYYFALSALIVVAVVTIIRHQWHMETLRRLRGGLACMLLCTAACLIFLGSIDTSMVKRVVNALPIFQQETTAASNDSETTVVAETADGETVLAADAETVLAADAEAVTGTETADGETVAASRGIIPDSDIYTSEYGDLALISGGFFDLLITSRSSLVGELGGVLVVAFALLALVILVIQLIRKRDGSADPTAIVIWIWIIGGLAAVSCGKRFVEILALPFALAAGLGVGIVGDFFAKKEMTFLSWFFMGLITLIPILGAYEIAKDQLPTIDTSFKDTCVWIKENTEEDAYVASWWDWGYYYQYEAERRTCGDGGTTTQSYCYWLGNMLLTDDPALAQGIARMMATSSVRAYNYLVANSSYRYEEVCDILKEILVLERDEAREILAEKYEFSENNVNAILDMTHPETDEPIYFVITQDMLSKVSAMNYYASWNYDTGTTDTTITENNIMQVLYNNTDGTYYNFTKVYQSEDPLGTYSAVIWRVD